MTEAQGDEIISLLEAANQQQGVLLWWVIFAFGVFVGFKLFDFMVRTASRSLYSW